MRAVAREEGRELDADEVAIEPPLCVPPGERRGQGVKR